MDEEGFVTPILLVPPVDPLHVTSPFCESRLDPVERKERRPHHGVDLRAAVGQPVFAAADGIVSRSYTSVRGPVDPATGKPKWRAYGERIVILHHGFSTSYAHLSKRVVKDGEVVRAGQLIGYAGNTGDSAGPHLHFELVIDGRRVDPMPHIKAH